MIFSFLNDDFELKDQILDFHGLHLTETQQILTTRLQQIQHDINIGVLNCNQDP